MTDHIERAHRAFPFIAMGPRFRQDPQERIQSSGCPSEKCDCVLQIMVIHGDYPWTGIFYGPICNLKGHYGICSRGPSVSKRNKNTENSTRQFLH
jgi:hypothetical protein